MPLCIDLVVQHLPPQQDAIGEYTSYLATELSACSTVRIITSSDFASEKLPGVTVEPCFSLTGVRRFAALVERLNETTAQALVIQYNPFGWGKRGWAPDLVRALKTFQRRRPDVILGIMFHETFMMNRGLRALLMRLYQRWQFDRLCQMADVCFFSVEKWAGDLKKRRPGSIVIHLPVGANLPRRKVESSARCRWGIDNASFVCGVFGGAHPSRMLPWIESGCTHIAAQMRPERDTVLLHVGGERIKWNVPGVRIVATGRLDALSAAESIAAMDLMLNPFADGISTRRGSAMAALQNGVPIATTQGPASDSIWTSVEASGVFLSDRNDQQNWFDTLDAALETIRTEKQGLKSRIVHFYETQFDWPVVCQKMLEGIERVRSKASTTLLKNTEANSTTS